MRNLKFTFKKREEGTTELDTVQLWIVKWVSMSLDCSFESDGTKWRPSTKWNHKAFASKESADLFKGELIAAFKLTGCCRWNVLVEKQDSYTNI